MRPTIPPAEVVLVDDPSTTVLRATLGLTLWLDDGAAWAREGAAVMLRSFLELPAARALRWYTGSTLDDVAPWDDLARERVLTLLPLGFFDARPRHLMGVTVVDALDAPRVAFRYREVDPARSHARGSLELTLPLDDDPGNVFQLVMEVATRLPFWSGTAGITLSWDRGRRVTSLPAAKAWCRRWVGVDLQDTERAAHSARRGLTGVGWITLLGRGFIEALSVDYEALSSRAWTHEVGVIAAPQGLVVRAGEDPELCDLNMLARPGAIAEVARALDPWLTPDLPPFEGWKPKETSTWLRRFAEPDAWT